MDRFRSARSAVEEEGVYIGGWSLKHVLFPKKKDGKHGESSHLKFISCYGIHLLTLIQSAARTAPPELQLTRIGTQKRNEHSFGNWTRECFFHAALSIF